MATHSYKPVVTLTRSHAYTLTRTTTHTLAHALIHTHTHTPNLLPGVPDYQEQAPRPGGVSESLAGRREAKTRKGAPENPSLPVQPISQEPVFSNERVLRGAVRAGPPGGEVSQQRVRPVRSARVCRNTPGVLGCG